MSSLKEPKPKKEVSVKAPAILGNESREAESQGGEAFDALDSATARVLTAFDLPEGYLEAPDSVSRRRFVQLMGASFALAGAAGCRWDRQNIRPEARRTAGHIPAVPKRYATATELGGVGLGLMVSSYEGRPIKVEGNPDHPSSLGATDLWAQASILELYDPDRSQRVVESRGGKQEVRSFTELTGSLAPRFGSHVAQRAGKGFAVLAGASSSQARAALKAELLSQFPEASWHEWEALSRDNVRDGAKLAFGRPVRSHFALEKAQIALCIDDDLLVGHPNAVAYGRAFALRRKPEGEWMSRWYAVESVLSQTGAMCDHRLPLRSSRIKAFLLALEAMVRGKLGLGPVGEAVNAAFLAEPKVKAFLQALSGDLAAHGGASVVSVGPRQAPEVHAIAHRLNAALGNHGSTITFSSDPDGERPTHVESLRGLVKAMHGGDIDTLLVLGGNPVFDAPADLDFAGALGKVNTSIHLSGYFNETSTLTSWHVPAAHYLEAWGDSRSWDGTVTVQQPLIAPFYKGISELEMLALVLGKKTPAREMVKQAVQKKGPANEAPALASAAAAESSAAPKAAAPAPAAPAPTATATPVAVAAAASAAAPPAPLPTVIEPEWKKVLYAGFVAGSAYPQEVIELVEFTVKSAANDDRVELVFTPDSRLYDGRFANNGWLQEQPDFITNLTWDNALLVNPADAKELGFRGEDVVRLNLDGRTLDVPVFIMPGQARGSYALAVGGGRVAAGQVGGLSDRVDSAGFNTYLLRSSAALWVARGVQLSATGRRCRLATTQEHHALGKLGHEGMDERLGEIVREADLDAYKKEPEFAKHMVHHPPLKSLWQEPTYTEHKWGMAIDLNACTGCGACMVACQAENNVPVVGKEQVLRNREMHWLRIDRYFIGDADNPEVAKQPVACQQCELAPCESVCPVAATSHSKEGLNDMVYNRCIGTRYCSNNCPYKVRHFNYFNFHKNLEEPGNEVLKLAFNPEVTVRSRGVMEKCTYCVQRIQAVKIPAKNARRTIRDGEIVSACQQACPTQAIVFGDLNDKASEVKKRHDDPRSYALLGELNVKPRTAYLAKVKNPHPDLNKA